MQRICFCTIYFSLWGLRRAAAAQSGSNGVLSQGKERDDEDGGMGEERGVKQTGTNMGQNQQQNHSHIIQNLEERSMPLVLLGCCKQ